MDRKAVSPVIAIVLLLMMTVAAAGAAYFWLTQMQSSVQQSAGSQIEAITKQASTRIIAQATLCKPPAEDDLIGYWKLDEGRGTTAEDSAGGNDGHLEDNNHSNSDGNTPPTWFNYERGFALEFDGVDDYVGGIYNNDLNRNYMGDRGSISVWVKAKGDGRVWEAEPKRPRLAYDYSTNRFTVYWFSRCSDTEETFGDSDAVYINAAPDEWHYISFLWNNNTGNWAVYKNGELYDSGNDLFACQFGWSGREFCFGMYCEHDRGYFKGSINEVRVYNSSSEKTAAMKEVDVTVYNAGAEEVPEGTWVANLKKNGNVIESDTYNASRLGSEERTTLKFSFFKLRPDREYKIELEGTETSTTVSC